MIKFIARLCLFIAVLAVPVYSHAQVSLSGYIADTHGSALPGAQVSVAGRLAISDSAGYYNLVNLPYGAFQALVKSAGYRDTYVTLNLKGKALNQDFKLVPAKVYLGEVKVLGKTNAATAKEQPQHLSVIDLKPYYSRPEGALALINQAAGVKVRQSGGLGSSADYYLNGLSGKQVRFFVDDLPLEFIGPGLNINLLPANIIDRIDIYKGVVPVRLGADALGGAINVLTRHNTANYLDASYAVSSFNTHRATLGFHRNIGKHFFTDFNGFYNTTANNYPVDVTVPNTFGNPENVTVSRFHDRFNNSFGYVKVGAKGLSWTDELSLANSLSASHQQVQSNPLMTQPYGRVQYNDQSRNTTIIYRKRRDRLVLRLTGGQSVVKGNYIDTSLNTYNWLGQVVARRSSNGESFGPLINLNNKQVSTLLRSDITYKLAQSTSLELSANYLQFKQTEDNPETRAFPVNLKKLVAGLALNRTFFDDRLTSITSVKYFNFSNQGYQFSPGGDINSASSGKQQWGWNEALRYILNDQVSFKASYEYASRLPDQTELFGTYIRRTRPNPGLIPETSHNVNLGFTAQNKVTGLSTNGFYRIADNLIYAPPSPFFLLYQNLLKAQFTGVEAEYWLKPFKDLRLDLNATYQNIINRSPQGNSGDAENRHAGLRLPNIPFLFANGQLLWNYAELLRQADRFSAWYQASYVHWYYLYWANDGDASTKAVIPTQFVQTAGLTYAIRNETYAISLEIQNITDRKVYDNYNAQLPGRSFHLKLHYTIK